MPTPQTQYVHRTFCFWFWHGSARTYCSERHATFCRTCDEERSVPERCVTFCRTCHKERSFVTRRGDVLQTCHVERSVSSRNGDILHLKKLWFKFPCDFRGWYIICECHKKVLFKTQWKKTYCERNHSGNTCPAWGQRAIPLKAWSQCSTRRNSAKLFSWVASSSIPPTQLNKTGHYRWILNILHISKVLMSRDRDHIARRDAPATKTVADSCDLILFLHLSISWCAT